MSQNRAEVLRMMLSQDPKNPLARYGLAMEHVNTGNLEEAVAEFDTLLADNPKYVAAYFHGGQTLERLGRTDEARQWYETGVEVTRRKGDQHALSEMQAALDLLG